MRITIVIPTYWGRPENQPFNPADAVYDHPTPIDQAGTLARTLNSLKILNRNDFAVIIIACATNEELEPAVEKKVSQVVDGYRGALKLGLLTPSLVNEMRTIVSGDVDKDTGSVISHYGYSNIRNLCLIAASLRGSDIALLIDDDEVIEYPEFLNRAVEFMDDDNPDSPIKAKAGWYMRPDGEYSCPPTCDPWWMEWRGAEAMNDGFDAIIARPGRLGPTPFAFGGNMAVHKDVFTQVAFDPKITRGEDIDYVFNSKMSGYEFIMDRELWVKHLPPKSRVPDWLGFRQNALRFAYARRKLSSQVKTDKARIVSVEELDPYPGLFLRDDLDQKILKTSALLGQKYLSEKDQTGYEESQLTLKLVEDLLHQEPDPFSWYMDFQTRWQTLMRFLPTSRPAAELMDKAFNV